MRAVVLFFLFFCFLLAGRTGSIYAGIPQGNTALEAAQKIQKNQSASFKNLSQDVPVVKTSTLTDKKEEFISIADEDEDLTFSRKHVVLVKFFITLTCASILIHFYNYFKNRLPFCRHLSHTSSYKYILQRVLRI